MLGPPLEIFKFAWPFLRRFEKNKVYQKRLNLPQMKKRSHFALKSVDVAMFQYAYKSSKTGIYAGIKASDIHAENFYHAQTDHYFLWRQSNKTLSKLLRHCDFIWKHTTKSWESERNERWKVLFLDFEEWINNWEQTTFMKILTVKIV